MRTVALLAIALVQAVDPPPRQLLNAARPLTPSEIAVVLSASRDALAGRTLRLVSPLNGQGPELRMGRAGLPSAFRIAHTIQGGFVGGILPGGGPPPPPTDYVEEVTTFIDYTGGTVRRCDGSREPGEMVIEYVRHGARGAWAATARRRTADDVGGLGFASAFTMLRGAGSLMSGERRQIAGREARALTAPWAPPPTNNVHAPSLSGDPAPNAIGDPVLEASVQSLWFDVASLLPLRWEVEKRGVRSDGFDIIYESIDLQPPAGVQAPDCIW
jgi:hypothetical protein